MMEIPVHDRQGNVVETIQFDESCLGKFVNMSLLHAAVVRYEANQRAGTACTKPLRALVGSTRKPFRQKGTGRARMGSSRRGGSVGGHTVHGPVPRDHSIDMPKKARRNALKSALLGKLRDGEVIVVDSLATDAPKTKPMAQMMTKLKADASKLVVVEAHDANVWKSMRNLDKTSMLVLKDLNAYQVLRNKHLVMTKAALQAIPQEVK